MRTLTLGLLFAAAVQAADFGRSLRDLRADDRQRRRAALEAFAEGRVRPRGRGQVEKLARRLQALLSDRYPGKERALAVRALGRLDHAKSRKKILDRLAKDLDDRVLAAAALAWRDAPKTEVGVLLRRIGEEQDPLVRAVWVRLLGELPYADAKRRIRMRVGMGDHWCPRAAAAHALARDRDPGSVAALVDLLSTSDPGLLTAAVESLTRLTGLRYGRDVVLWRTWWATTARDKQDPVAKADRAGGARRYAHEIDDKPIRPYYFGLVVRGKKVVFVFDVSASMRYKLPLAYDQLSRAVKALPSTSFFEVVFFNEQVRAWRGRLSHADPVTKELLVRHLKRIEIKSYTNLYDSIEKAISLGPDEIFVISDGEPNRGRWRSARDILRELKKLNVRRVPIHTISVVRTVDGDKHIGLLRRIAEEHGGQAVQRTLK